MTTRYFLLPFETWVPEHGPMKGRTGYRPKYHGELGYGFEIKNGKTPDRDFCLIDIRVPELASHALCDKLASMPDVEEIRPDSAGVERMAKIRAECRRRCSPAPSVGAAVRGALNASR